MKRTLTISQECMAKKGFNPYLVLKFNGFPIDRELSEGPKKTNKYGNKEIQLIYKSVVRDGLWIKREKDVCKGSYEYSWGETS